MANGCINNLQMEHGMDSFGTEFRYRQPETGQLQGGTVPVDFATIAAGYGCKTRRVTTWTNCATRWTPPVAKRSAL